MALTGELTDLSLAELIEFFCNQRKTGRLKVVYPTGPGYFYLQSGSVVHARVGDLRGIEAVYFALTQRNASFTFSPAFEAPEHSINQPWTSVVLEGLRRMDEGIRPPNPFPEGSASAVEEVESLPIEELKSSRRSKSSNRRYRSKRSNLNRLKQSRRLSSKLQLPRRNPRRWPGPVWRNRHSLRRFRLRPSRSCHRLSNRHDLPPNHGRWVLVIAAIVLIIGVVAVPWGWYARSKAARLANEPRQPVVTEPAASNSAGRTERDARPLSPRPKPQLQSRIRKQPTSLDVNAKRGSERKREREPPKRRHFQDNSHHLRSRRKRPPRSRKCHRRPERRRSLCR